MNEKKTVLFICSFNSVRSQIAEGLLRAACGEWYEVFSAGVAPAGLNPLVVAVMREIGIDISKQRSKSLSAFTGKKFDYVVTLCDQAQLAASRTIPGGIHIVHRGFVSPSELQKNKQEILSEYRKLRDSISAWLPEIFPEYPLSPNKDDGETISPQEKQDVLNG